MSSKTIYNSLNVSPFSQLNQPLCKKIFGSVVADDQKSFSSVCKLFYRIAASSTKKESTRDRAEVEHVARKLIPFQDLAKETEADFFRATNSVNFVRALTPEERFEAAKHCFGNNIFNNIRHIESFVLNHKQKVELLKIHANGYRINVLLLPAQIKEIKLSNKSPDYHRFEVAKRCAQNHGGTTAEHIRNFGLTPEQNHEVAKLCAQNDGGGTAKHIKNFELTSEQGYEVAKLCAQNHGGETAEHVKNFELTSEQGYEVVRLCAQNHGWGTAKHVKNFELTPKQNYEVAKLCYQNCSWSIAEHIKNFELTPEQNYEIATLCAQKDGGGTAKHIKNFELTPEQDYEIAKLCAQKDSGGTAKHIKNFELTPEQNYEIAKLCVQKDGEELIENIRGLKFTNKAPDYQCFEIAKLCAQQNGGKTARHIKDFELTNEAPDYQRFEIAKLCAQKNGGGTARHIKNFELTPEQNYEVAKLCAQNNGGGAAENIHNFQLTNEAPDYQRFEIAKLCAQNDGGGTAENIHNFQLTNEAPDYQRFEIAKLCAQDHASRTAEHIKDFGLTPEQNYEVAKLCPARRTGGRTAEHIKNFGLTPEQNYEIAKLCAQDIDGGTAENIDNFELTNEAPDYRCFEIAKLCAQNHGGTTAAHIKKFGLTSEQNYEVAKLCAQNDGGGTAQHVKKFGLTPKQNYEVSKLCARKHGGGTATYIKKFGLTPEQNYEVAKLCAQGGGGGPAENIDNFKLTNEAPDYQLFEIAKLCAQNHGGTTARYIKNFGFTPEQNYEVAKLCAQDGGGRTARYIENFGLTPKQNYEVSKLCAQDDGGETAENIDNFKLTNEAPDYQRFEIAKLCAQDDGGETAKHIRNFGLTPEQNYEVAKLCAQDDGGGTAKHIRNFRLTPEQNYEVAKLCAQTDGGRTARYIKNFELTPEQNYEVAKLCGQDDGSNTAKYIKNFGLTPEQNYEIAKLCAIFDPTWIKSWLSESNFSDDQKKDLFLLGVKQDPEIFKDIAKMKFSSKGSKGLEELFSDWEKKSLDEDKIVNTLTSFIQDKFPYETDYFIKKVAQIRDSKVGKTPQESEYLKKRLYSWMAASLFILSFENLSEEESSWLAQIDPFEKLKDLRELTLRHQLVFLLSKIVKEESLRAAYKQYGKDGALSLERKYAYTKLFRLILAGLQQAGLSFQEVNDFASEMDQMYSRSKKGKKSPFFWDANRFRMLVQPLYHLIEDKELEAREKKRVIERLTKDAKIEGKIDNKKLIENLCALMRIIDFKATSRLKEPFSSLPELAEQIFKEKVPIETCPNFSERFEKTFAASRYPDAVTIYASKIHSLSDAKATRCFAQFVTLVLAGEEVFKNERYNLESNPHLKTLFSKDPDLLTRWRQGSSIALQELISKGKQKQTTTDMTQFLRTKLEVDKHLDLNQLPLLQSGLMTQSSDELKILWNEASEALKNDQGNFSLLLQKQCLQLMRESDSAGQLKILEHIKETLPKCPFSYDEFANDIDGCITTLQESEKELELSSYTVVDSDEPFDLFFSGKVEGSCQRFDGDPKLNKGLLGYMMNGQNRLIAIKDRSGKICARGVLRLLWDGSRPVLFLERLYPEGLRPEFEAALIAMAKKKAEALKVPLTSHINKEADLYPHSLQSLGGIAPYEYCDAVKGITKDGICTIANARILGG